MKRRDFVKAIRAAALLPASFSVTAENAEAADAAEAGDGSQSSGGTGGSPRQSKSFRVADTT